VPDAILDRADELELVDLPPDELLIRVAEGKVHLPAQLGRAAERFYAPGSLLALRELAMRRAADRLDMDVQAYRRVHEIESIWPSSERLLACVGPGPGSERLVRAASRIAAGRRAPWVAAFAEGGRLLARSPAEEARLEAHLRLAESLGAEVVRLSGTRVAEALLHHARRRNVTRILVGRPSRPRLRGLLGRTLVEQLVRGAGEIDVHVISGEPLPEPAERPASRAEGIPWTGYGWAGAWVALASGASGLVRGILALPDLVTIYLLVIMIVAVRFGRGPSILASALSVLAYDFFFVPPFFTFAVARPQHVLTFAMMFVVGLLMSALTSRIRRQAQEARVRESHTATLYALSRDLGSAIDEEQVALVIARHGAEVFERGTAVLLPDASGAPGPIAKSGPDLPLEAQELAAARWCLEHGRAAGCGTETLPAARVLCVPVRSGAEALGVLAIDRSEREPLGTEERHFVDAFVRQAALALERARLVAENKAAALRARTEELRSSLLSAVSHDLRTPLAAMTGAATTLRDHSSGLSPTERVDLLDTLCEEAERLERLVANLLDMTRVEAGALEVKREWIPLEEIVGAALGRLEERLAGRPIATDLPADLPLLPVDPCLLEQVFINLLENAAKYTPHGSPIEIRARAESGGVALEVADRGPGLPEGVGSRVLERFVRGSHPGVGGVGLGLPICAGIVEAHGGSFSAENRPGGGAVFRLTLPLVGEPPPLPVELTEAPPGSEPA